MSYLKHSEVVSSIPSKFETAKSSGALFFYPSTHSKAPERGLNFEITVCPALQQKPVLPEPTSDQTDKPDPFAPPYVPDLYVGDLKDELDGDEYVILLNKYSVISGHFLMVTKDFKSQNGPLTPPDLTQTYLLIRASHKSQTPLFAFYNCGVDSGASQPHKHVQFIPTTREDADDEDEEEDTRPPVEAYVQGLKIEDDTKAFSLPLPYAHFVQKLHLPKSTVSGTKPLSPQSLEELSARLTSVFLTLLDEAVQSLRLHPTPTTTQASMSYNLILTSEHMHLVPRTREKTLEEDGAYSLHPLNVNTLGFAGMVLAKSEDEARAIKERGVVALLGQVGVLNSVEKIDAPESA
ncbi:ATP adenylyltransferase [Rhizoctonia solani AG-3 Rhs1AP]|uniref:ATP adenylyltransferase n=1 Tax=Rhizoctonia solani AG-3 Rhs1AP TaxID=1086054 RepID=X8JHV5_9AGAM|nr:ATP adenylyltransferase [Rhizoctonia solani AG-3 Rhs1AP]